MSSYSEFRQLNYCNIARERAYLLYIHRSKFNRVWQILTREFKTIYRRIWNTFDAFYLYFRCIIHLLAVYKAYTLILPPLMDCLSLLDSYMAHIYVISSGWYGFCDFICRNIAAIEFYTIPDPCCWLEFRPSSTSNIKKACFNWLDLYSE